MTKTVFKMAAVILGTIWCTVAIRCSSATDGTTFDPSRFLHRLGLHDRPKPAQDSVIPAYMLRMYRQSTEKYLRPGITVRSIQLEGNSANSSCCDQFSFRYDLSSLDSEEKLLRATVRLPNVFGPDERPSLLASMSERIHPLHHRRLNHPEELVFEMTDDVSRCRALQLGNDVATRWKCSFTLEVTTDGRSTACRKLTEGLDAVVVVVTRRASGGQQPSSRATRAADRRTLTKRPLSKRLCQRQEMYVDFRKIGWSGWIIAPAGYSAFYCAGSCPFPISEHLNTTNHAIIQTLAHSMEPQRVATTCCVPTHFAPISMLYYDDKNNVVLKQYDNMVVDACGCR